MGPGGYCCGRGTQAECFDRFISPSVRSLVVFIEGWMLLVRVAQGDEARDGGGGDVCEA